MTRDRAVEGSRAQGTEGEPRATQAGGAAAGRGKKHRYMVQWSGAGDGTQVQ